MSNKPITATQTETTQWPQDLSFKAFAKISPASEDWIYKTVYALRSEQIQVRNERIALIKLRKILRATFKLTATVGFHSMSLRELSKESGVSMGGIYSYIGSKEELANLIADVLSEIGDQLTTLAISELTDTRTKLAALLSCQVYLAEQLHPWFYFVFMESKTLSKAQVKQAKQTELDYETRIIEIIEQGIAEGLFETDSPSLAAAGIIALLQDWHLKRWKFRSKGTTPDHYAQYLLGVVWAILGIKDK